MKTSLLNIAVTMALTSAVFSGSVLFTQAYADAPASDESVIADNNNSNDNTTETYLYSGMGIGAASGTLIAGPVGFVVGGLIGAIVGVNQDVSTESESISIIAENTADKEPVSDNAQYLNENDFLTKTTEQETAQPSLHHNHQ